MPNSRAVDFNIFYDSSFSNVVVSFPNITAFTASTTKTVHLTKITLWVRIYICEIPYYINDFFSELVGLFAQLQNNNGIEQLLECSNSLASVQYDDNNFQIQTKQLADYISTLICLWNGDVAECNADADADADNIPLLRLDKSNIEQEQFYATSLRDFYAILFSPQVRIEGGGIIDNPLNMLVIKKCKDLNRVLRGFKLRVNGSTLGFLQVFQILSKTLSCMSELVNLLICCAVNVRGNCSISFLQQIKPILDFTTKKSVKAFDFIRNQENILYNELPAFSAVNYLIAKLVFNDNRNFVNDNRVFTNNPYFSLNSNQLVLPANYHYRPCTRTDDFSYLPNDLCDNIDSVKILEFYYGFPYWNNSFTNLPQKMHIDIFNQFGVRLPITVREISQTNEIYGTDNFALQSSIIEAHLFDQVTAMIDVFNDFVITSPGTVV